MPRIRRSYRALLAALITLAPVRITAAQATAPQSLAPGTRVRVTSNQMVAPIVGSYQGMRRDTLVVIEDGSGAKIWAFNTTAVSQVEVSLGMKGGNRDPMIRWGLIGARHRRRHRSHHRDDAREQHRPALQRSAEYPARRRDGCRARRLLWVAKARGALGTDPTAAARRPGAYGKRSPHRPVGVLLTTATAHRGRPSVPFPKPVVC